MVLTRYQQGLETSLKGCKIVFISIEEMHYKFQKISLNLGGW